MRWPRTAPSAGSAALDGTGARGVRLPSEEYKVMSGPAVQAAHCTPATGHLAAAS